VEQLIIEFGNELMYDRDLSDVTFERAKALYGNRAAIEMSFLMGYYGMIGCLVRVAGMDPRPNGPDFRVKTPSKFHKQPIDPSRRQRRTRYWASSDPPGSCDD
jgi:hypothetical protein